MQTRSAFPSGVRSIVRTEFPPAPAADSCGAAKDAIRLLEALVAAEPVVEVTLRSKRRLVGLEGLAPLRQVV
jgi:hypothetical protein